ncbi:MAG: hypothetical protein ACJ8NR_05890 [Sulfurifustis sp.]
MTDDTQRELVEIRTFASMEEVHKLNGFRENNGVTKENYRRLFGDYWFADEVRCCFQKPNGVLCGEDHKAGFVVELIDGSYTILGNVCARDKFGADHKIKADRSRYLREKARRDKFAQLGELLTERESRLSTLASLRERLKEASRRIEAFLATLGDRTVRRLRDMARSGNPNVSVEAIIFRKGKDDQGNEYTERRATPTTLGSLNGLSVLNEYSLNAVYSGMTKIAQAYQRAREVTEDVKTSELENLTAVLADFGRVVREAENLEQEEAAFFQNDMSLLCFLVDDKAERYKAARVALGEAGSKEKAKSWLTEREQEIKRVLSADKISIPF